MGRGRNGTIRRAGLVSEILNCDVTWLVTGRANDRMSDADADLNSGEVDITGRHPAAVGRRLLLTRKVFDLNQIEFSKRAEILNSAYNQFENGVHRPSMESAMALCDAYHLTLDWIYRGDLRGLRHETAAAILALSRVGAGGFRGA